MDQESQRRQHDDVQKAEEDKTSSMSNLFAELEGQSLFGSAEISTFPNVGRVSLGMLLLSTKSSRPFKARVDDRSRGNGAETE